MTTNSQTSAAADDWRCSSAQLCTCRTTKAFLSRSGKNHTRLLCDFWAAKQWQLQWLAWLTSERVQQAQRLTLLGQMLPERPFCTLPYVPPCKDIFVSLYQNHSKENRRFRPLTNQAARWWAALQYRAVRQPAHTSRSGPSRPQCPQLLVSKTASTLSSRGSASAAARSFCTALQAFLWPALF